MELQKKGTYSIIQFFNIIESMYERMDTSLVEIKTYQFIHFFF